MIQKRLLKILLLVIGLSLSFGAFAEGKPRWVTKGVKELNANRFSDTYSFHMFHTVEVDKRIMYLNRFGALKDYIDSVYQVPNRVIFLDSIPAADGGRPTYTLSFDKDGQKKVVYAQLVDEYTKLDDFVTNQFEYNYWQLFAISEPGVQYPQFDDFTLTRHFNRAKATAASIIPGLGQLYKGQKVKGIIIMSTEAVLIGSLIWSDYEYRYFKRRRAETGDPHFHNTMTTYKELRAFSAIAAAGLYVYNLFDAALCNIPRRVEISRPNAPAMEMSFGPAIMPDAYGVGFGVGMSLTF